MGKQDAMNAKLAIIRLNIKIANNVSLNFLGVLIVILMDAIFVMMGIHWSIQRLEYAKSVLIHWKDVRIVFLNHFVTHA